MDARIDVAPIRCINCHFFSNEKTSLDNNRVIISIPNMGIFECLLPL